MKSRTYLLSAIVIAACSCISQKQNKITDHAGNLSDTSTTCYKGKLIISGICRQKVVILTSSDPGTLAVDSAWKNPNDGIVYKNAFSVKNVCDFPESIKVGDLFDFKIIAAQKSNCSVCLAYVPVPSSMLLIETGCK